MYNMHMSSKILIPNKESATVEKLIEGLDQRGLLVFLVLLGQQAMSILSEDHTKTVISGKNAKAV